MSNFRIKNLQKKTKTNIKDSSTLEKKHITNTQGINNTKLSLEKLKNDLFKTEMDLNKIEKERANNVIINLKKRSDLLNKKSELENKIKKIESNNEEINYYDLTGDLINEYYELRNTDLNNESETKNILEYLNPSSTKDSKKTNKAELFDKFCQRLDGVRVNKDDGTNRIKYCKECNVEKTLDQEESSYICPVCGIMEFVIIDEDKQIKDYSPYQRRNHFKEWLNQFQAKETTEISDEIFQEIINELNKNRITDMGKLNRSKMQKILKKLGHNKLYEHIPFIINKISGVPAPKINRDIEEKFIYMFSQIQEPWEIYKPSGRKNFLSYPYILYKFSELLELDHLLSYFPMLQPTKLMEQDVIWQKFCKHLKWEFYPTT